MKKLLSLCLSLCLFVTLVAQPPANDNCGTAPNIAPIGGACGATGGQTLFNATNSGITNVYGTTYDVWYRFTPPAGVSTVNIALSTLGGSLSNANTFIEVFNAAVCGSISTATSLGSATNANSGLTLFNATALTQYYCRVFVRSNPNTGATGNWAFSICISYLAAPANDNCTGAIALTPGVTYTTTTSSRLSNATASAGIPVCASGTPDDDVWYSFVANNNYANVEVGANAALANAVPMVQVFSGTCTPLALTSLACGRESAYVSGLTIGNTYYIRVFSFNAKGTPSAGPSNGTASGAAAFSIAVLPGSVTNVDAGRMNEIYQVTLLADSLILADPWEITYGPDNYLWITESKGARVLRMNPTTGARTTVLDLSEKSTFLPLAERTFNVQFSHTIAGAQGGLAGLAVHPKFLDPVTPKNFVYVAYIHSYNGGSSPTGIFYTNRVVRFTYNTGTGLLESPVSLCDTLPGSSDHNSQRMIIAPVSGTNYLFYAQGDMGAGQFGNATRPNKAQNQSSYEGKILRFNLESDGDPLLNAWIPNTNPFGATSAVWSTGIRNNQGFAYDSVLNILFGSSHGPFTDDEINAIEPSKNYGHPLVIGYSWDDNVNNTTAGAGTFMSPPHPSSCPVIVDESNAAGAIANYKDPLFSAYPNSPAYPNIYTNIWNNNPTPNNGGWPSEGWSGLDIYKHTLVPGWKSSLVAASLKWGRLVRLRLNATGTQTAPTNTAADTVSYFGSTNRFRDLAFNPNGKDVYVIMDRSTTSSGPSSGNPIVPACKGCLQKYTFLGYANAGGISTIPTSIDVTDGTNNTCNTGTTVTIDNTNRTLWVPITGPDGNIMAEIKANLNVLGTVTSSFYEHTGPIRVTNGRHYLNRNITITTQNPVTSNVDIRLYISKAEYDLLDADGLSGINSISDLKIQKNNDVCSGTALTSTTMITTTGAAHGANGYVLQGVVNGFSSFYFANGLITLPVNLLAFTGTLQTNRSVLLKWKTENEINTSHFQVERSVDGINFSAIGSVTATGNASSGMTFNYSLTDADAVNQQSLQLYYRLKMFDRDGAFKYSNVVPITLPVDGSVTISPNPVINELNVMISAPADGMVQWKLYDNTGRTVLQSSELVRKGNGNNFIINMNKLAQGSYYLNISGAGIDRQIKLQKF